MRVFLFRQAFYLIHSSKQNELLWGVLGRPAIHDEAKKEKTALSRENWWQLSLLLALGSSASVLDWARIGTILCPFQAKGSSWAE